MSAYTGIAPNFEVPDTATEEYDDENGLMSASVTVRCAYVDRHLVAGDACANRRPWPKGAFGLVPKASRASIKGELNLGSVTNDMWFPLTALVTLYYTTRTADIITESLEPTQQGIRLDYRMFRWASGSGDMLSEEEAPSFLVRGINFVRTSYYVQPPLDPDLLSLNGFVNDSAFSSTLLTLTFDEETLLFGPPVINRKLNSNGVQQFDVVKKWTYQPNGWNKYYRTQDDAWEEIFLVGASTPTKSYPRGDMTSLLSW